MQPIIQSPNISLNNEVHVRCFHLTEYQNKLLVFLESLSGPEIERYNRFVFTKHKNSYAISHGLLRELIGYYIDHDPKTIDFEHTYHGKPFLRDQRYCLHFNMSHSNNAVAYAFTNICDVGIDIEHIAGRGSFESLIPLVLSAKEQEDINLIDSSRRPLRFYQLWTCKEAIVKAIGGGLTLPLQDIEIMFDMSGQPQLSSIFGSIEAARQWSLFSIDNLSGYACTVAVKKGNVKIKLIK